MDLALTLSPWLGAFLLAVGLVALARGANAKAVLGTFLPGLALLGLPAARQRDVLLVVGLALAGLAVILALERPAESPPGHDRSVDDEVPPDADA